MINLDHDTRMLLANEHREALRRSARRPPEAPAAARLTMETLGLPQAAPARGWFGRHFRRDHRAASAV